ncbi:isopenicillin N synthase family dioxygenase [Salinisphaera aquimarina]|uniref:Isopenicillin N synthase family dioxygenase n=1 Tax=Salinisphaera aquimarina TaxID=2094031 RepID=A0ABV7EK04_9GAMM
MTTRQPTAFESIPAIDIAPLFGSDTAAQQTTAQELGRAARDVGFFYVVNHGISETTQQALFDQTKRFFDLPLRRKMDYYIGKSNNHRGYVPAGEEAPDPTKADAKEAFDLSYELPGNHPEVVAGTPMMGANVWPDLDGFADDVYAYYQAVFGVGQALMRGFETALGLDPDALLSQATQPPSQLRLIHYPFDPNVTDAQGIGAHTDYECFTLLRPTAPGLEVMNGAGEWVDVPYREDALVVNIGDMLEIWTNGAFVATSHRVRKVKEERYSFPLFFAADYHTKVAPLPALLAEHEKPKYGPLAAGDHLWAQTIQTFNYLKKRLANGEIQLPEGARGAGTLGQHARHKDDA